MNKYTIRQLFKRAYESRLREIDSGGWKARSEIEKTPDIAKLNRTIKQLTDKRDKAVNAFVEPRKKKAQAQRDELKKLYSDLDIRLGFAITSDEKKAVVLEIKKFLKSLPNCPEAKLIG